MTTVAALLSVTGARAAQPIGAGLTSATWLYPATAPRVAAAAASSTMAAFTARRPAAGARVLGRRLATAAGGGERAASATSASVSSTRGPPHEEALRRPLIICGPSGVGKGTLLGLMLQEFGSHFGFSVSHTTRGPRPGEEAGVHYHFTTHEEMRAGVAAGRFLEHATVHGNMYGTSFEAVRAVQRAGKVCVLDIDVQGVVSVKAAHAEGRLEGLDPLYVFVAPPSLDALEARLRGRQTETEEQLQRRLCNAAREVEYGLAAGNFNKIVVNGELEAAYSDLVGFLEERYYPPPAPAK